MTYKENKTIIVFEEFKKFWFENQRLPKSGKEYRLYDWYNRNKLDYQPLIEFCDENGIDMFSNEQKTSGEIFIEFKEFLFKFRRFPSRVSKDKEERRLYGWYRKNLKKYKPLMLFLTKNHINTNSRYYSSSERLKQVLELWTKSNELPSSKNDKGLYDWFWSNKNKNGELKVFLYLIENQDNSNNKILLDLYIKQHKG